MDYSTIMLPKRRYLFDVAQLLRLTNVNTYANIINSLTTFFFCDKMEKEIDLEVASLFNVGDKVVYPMHGAGVIEAIEEKEILGETKQYYVMKIPIGDMKVMIPLGHGNEIGLREVTDELSLNQIISGLKSDTVILSTNWNRRYRANMDKIKSGDVHDVAEVVKELMYREREKGLSTGERKMLDNAKQILISELVLSKGIEESEALALLSDMITEKDASN
jgi:CarD family transcriptional regulator